MEISLNPKRQHMKELHILHTLAGNATINQLEKEVWLNTKRVYMNESNILACNATITQLQRKVWISKSYYRQCENQTTNKNHLSNRKCQYMKESNILVGNATIKQLKRVVLLNRERTVHEGMKYFAGNVFMKS